MIGDESVTGGASYDSYSPHAIGCGRGIVSTQHVPIATTGCGTLFCLDEAFNVFNHTNFLVGDNTSLHDPLFGIAGGTNPPRNLQFGLKVGF